MDEVVYILVSIKNNEGNSIDSGHYYCNILEHNIVTWQICDNDNISEIGGHAINLYNELSHEDIQNKKKKTQ